MFRCRFALLFLLFALVAAPLSRAVSEKDLPPRYRHWLQEEAAYIIQSDERAQFLSLKTDAERDSFIHQFWEARNPTPGVEPNTYKEEHYRRLAYANEHFGDPRLENGWRTDRGQVYITLGEPKQIVTYPNSRNVRPMIAWFYQSPTPALPPFFYVLFYKRSIGDPYTIYSPYQDGPVRLVTGLEALNDQKRSLQALRKSLGDEVARMTLSLIPSEPVNFDDYSPSMMSDAMLATIRGLADNDLEKRRITENRNREKVTASILTAGDTPDAGYTVSRDEHEESTVNYLIAFRQPDPTLIGQRRDKKLGYDLTLRSHITTETGKTVYDDVEVLTGEVSPAQAEVGRKKAFAAEERLPLASGTYLIESTLTNNLNLRAHRVREKVVVPAPKSSVLGISAPFVYSGNPARDPQGQLPFSLSHVRFGPRAVQTVAVRPGDRLPCVFQLWVPKTAAGTVRSEPVQLHYYFASASLSGGPLDEADETVETANADAAGNLVTGHVFSTADLNPGTNYRLIIRATQAGSPPVYATMDVHVVASEEPISVWSAYGPPQPSEDEAKRKLSAEAQATAPQTKASVSAKP